MIYAVQLILPFLGLCIVCCCFGSLFGNISPKRALIALYDKTNNCYHDITYWENSIGRDKHSDVVLDNPMVSRRHSVLFRRERGWFIADTNSKSGTRVNGRIIEDEKKVYINDVLTIGETDFVVCRAKSSREKRNKLKARFFSGTYSSFFVMVLITIFNFLSFGLISFAGETFDLVPMMIFSLVMGISWIQYLISKYGFGRVNFELESLAIFLSSIGVAVCSSVDVSFAYTQTIALGLGMIFFDFIVYFIKNPDFAMKCRPYVAGLALILLVINLAFGSVKNGSQNWIMIGNISVQPSEIIKVAFVYFGASTLRSLQTAKNLTGFIIFSCLCMAGLFVMSDFGAACIFFVAFLIIGFMRSGSIRNLVITLVMAIMGVLFILKFKPYILERFSAWRHVWQHSADIGYQQTRVLCYSSSGGLLGMGIGKGCLKYIFAASSDLVFGMICEEWGIILGFMVVISIALIALYAGIVSLRSRSAFYAISACGAAGIIVFQMMMHVFGSVDILPLTGVTLPLVSMGGSSIVATWGLLAFIKSADDRTYGIKK